MSHKQYQPAQRPAHEPSRGVVGSFFGVLAVLLVGLVGLAWQAEGPMLLPTPAATELPSLSSPSPPPPHDGAALPVYPPPAGDDAPVEPPPSF